MDYVSYDDGRKLDREEGVKNIFNERWMDETDHNGHKLSSWCKKVRSPGVAACIECNCLIKYLSKGKSALHNHASAPNHCSAIASKKNSTVLPMTTPVLPSSIVCLDDRVQNQIATISATLAEQSIPYASAPTIVNLAKELSRDPEALRRLPTHRTTYSYKTEFGVGRTFRDEVIDQMRNNPFSLNLDESTSKAGERILDILCHIFDDSRCEVVTHHVDALKLKGRKAIQYYKAIESLFHKNNIPSDNLVSVMMDSCSTMRGRISGLETLIRKRLAPNLIDADGDTCHTVNNAAEKFVAAFEDKLQIFARAVHTDIKQSVNDEFAELCMILNIDFVKPLRVLDHRFLYMDAVARRLDELLLPLSLFYSVFSNDQKVKEEMMKEIENEKQRKQVDALLEKIGSTRYTQSGVARKESIAKVLFFDRMNLLLQLKFYNDVLPYFRSYLKLFQCEDPKMDQLHSSMWRLTLNLLSFFVKPEALKKAQEDKAALLDVLENDENFLPLKSMFVGTSCTEYLQKCIGTATAFLKRVRSAYLQSVKHLLTKLPLENPFIVALASLSPGKRGTSSALESMKCLASCLSKDQSAAALPEIHACISSADQVMEMKPRERLDSYWHRVTTDLKWPNLWSIIKRALTCFHGPDVEGAFNRMGQLIRGDRTRLDVSNISAQLTIKYALKAKQMRGFSCFHRADIRRSAFYPKLLPNMADSWRKLRASQAAEERRPAAGLFKRKRLLLKRRKRLEQLQESVRKSAVNRRNLWLSRGGGTDQNECPVVGMMVPSSASEGTSTQQIDKRARPSEDVNQDPPKKKKMKQMILFPIDKNQ